MTFMNYNYPMRFMCWLLLGGWLSYLPNTSAQLAITEVMSSATTTSGTSTVAANSDWWELTNFGTNAVDLTGYKWNDNQGGLLSADPFPFVSLSIRPGESIIFFQSNAPASSTPAQFKEWWGGGISPGTQAILYQGNGLSSTGDGVRLWGPAAADDFDTIDSVDFGVAIKGVSFAYHPTTGLFDAFSTNGLGGAVKAAVSDDVASPGRTTGPVGIVITQQPTNTAVNPGDTAQFSVLARGLPRPNYQWFLNEEPIIGARFATLFVTNASPTLAGRYSVRLDSGFQSIRSDTATLTLNALPEPPVVTLPPQDASLFVGQSVRFRCMASGFPQPTYQWSFAGKPLDGATEAILALTGVGLTDAGTYQVTASNSLGQVSAEARLVVTPRPRLVVTEIMAAPDTNGPVRGHNDWWELTNLGESSVDLKGYRFDDSSALLAASIVVTNDIKIAPGESVVFVESMTDLEFKQWWGPGNFKNGQQIITYRGGGLSLSSLGDAINLWNSGALEDFDTVASEVFSTATNGISFTYDAAAASFGNLSTEGFGGAWRSYENRDVGSPGVIRNPTEPRILSFTSSGGKDRLTWTSIPSRNYRIQTRPRIAVAGWQDEATVRATESLTSHELNSSSTGQFYQLMLLP